MLPKTEITTIVFPGDAKIAVINRYGTIALDGTITWCSGPQWYRDGDKIVAMYRRKIHGTDELKLCMDAVRASQERGE